MRFVIPLSLSLPIYGNDNFEQNETSIVNPVSYQIQRNPTRTQRLTNRVRYLK